MGKRSSFERIPRDFYPTPEAAVPPLLPFLRGVRTFDLSVLHLAVVLDSVGPGLAHAARRGSGPSRGAAQS